ncbi:hypothetical protein ACJJTC_017713 [Scirpophaga incertulas]
MEELKKKRTILRRFFSNAEKDMLAAFDEKRSDISALYKYFEDKAEELLKIDDEIRDLLFQSNLEEDKIFKELEIAEEYRRRFYKHLQIEVPKLTMEYTWDDINNQPQRYCPIT